MVQESLPKSFQEREEGELTSDSDDDVILVNDDGGDDDDDVAVIKVVPSQPKQSRIFPPLPRRPPRSSKESPSAGSSKTELIELCRNDEHPDADAGVSGRSQLALNLVKKQEEGAPMLIKLLCRFRTIQLLRPYRGKLYFYLFYSRN